MSQAIKARILKQVRQKIADGSSTYICLALDEIAEQDHRRNIQTLCNEIKADVLGHIAPHKSFGDLLARDQRVTCFATIKQARLKWLDRQIGDKNAE